MKKKSKIIIVLSCVLALVGLGNTPNTMHGKQKKLGNVIQQADDLFYEKDYTSALSSYKNALTSVSRAEDKAPIYENITMCLFNLKLFNESIVYCKKILKLLPELPVKKQNHFALFAYYGLGSSFSKTGTLKKAIFYLEKATPLMLSTYGIKSKRMVDHYERLANLYAKIKDFETSRKITVKQLKISVDKGKYDDACRFITLFSFSFYEQKKYHEAISSLSLAFFYLQFCSNNQQTLLRKKLYYIKAFYSFECGEIDNSTKFLFKSMSNPIHKGQKILLQKIVHQIIITTLPHHPLLSGGLQGSL